MEGLAADMDKPIRPEHFEQIKQIYPDVTTDCLRAVHDGLVNDVVIVNEERIFRFPKNDDWARDLLRQEIRVLELINDKVTLDIPRYDIVTDAFVSYPLIQGEPLYGWDLLRLSENQQDSLAEKLAEFLTEMHGVPLDSVRAAGIGDSNVNRPRDVWMRLLSDVQRELFPHMMPHSRHWVAAHFEPLLRDEHFMDYNPVLMNGDIPCDHLLWNKTEAKLTGVIDFGTAGIGDPAADYACVIYNYGETFLTRMARYDPAIEDAVNRARFWAGTSELQWALTGIRRKSPIWHTVHVGSAKDMSPIGVPFGD